ncbi:MAG TPA: EamA family transporter [Verrucomicrobiae bacterium]|nr:EamA family transporter [Verrucomicrobiae bacterium]
MHTGLVVALFGLVSAISWGVSDFFSAKSAKSVGPMLGTTLISIVGAFIYSVAYIVLLRHHHNLPMAGFVYAVAAGLFFALGGAAFFTGLEAGPVSIVSPVSSVYPLFMTLLTVTIFRTHLTIRELIGILLVVIGVTVASDLLTSKDSKRRVGKGPAFALLTAVTWGIAYVFLAQAIKRGDWQIMTLVEYIFAALGITALLPFMKGNEVVSIATVRSGFRNKFIVGAGAIQIFAFAALSIGIAKSTASGGTVVTAISACYPILTIFLALKHFNEEFRLVPLIGVVVGVAGVVLLSL